MVKISSTVTCKKQENCELYQIIKIPLRSGIGNSWREMFPVCTCCPTHLGSLTCRFYFHKEAERREVPSGLYLHSLQQAL